MLSRTVGLVGPLAGVEDVGAPDAIAAVLASVACVTALAALLVGARGSIRLDVPVLIVSGVAVLALVVPAMAAPHTHGDHEHGEIAATAHDESAGHTHGDTVDAGSTHSHGDASTVDDTAPIVSLADARLTEAQRARAIAILVSTRAAMLARFPDRASVEAAGYVWIGDGRRAGGYEHFVQQDYMADGHELDPDHIESIVLQRQADGSERVVTAMYILERGKTMADVPDVAGALTTWHDHQNLCWDANGKLAGIVVNGQCRPGGTFRADLTDDARVAHRPTVWPVLGRGRSRCRGLHPHARGRRDGCAELPAGSEVVEQVGDRTQVQDAVVVADPARRARAPTC